MLLKMENTKRESTKKINHDESTSGGDMINVLPFASSRLKELEYLERQVRTMTGNRRAFQMLPRHLRRRAASHYVKRIPRKYRELREQAGREVEKTVMSNPLLTTPTVNIKKVSKKATIPPTTTTTPITNTPTMITSSMGIVKEFEQQRRKRLRRYSYASKSGTRRANRICQVQHSGTSLRKQEYLRRMHRHGRCQWLETHIWHGKRMKMELKWKGYCKVATCPNDKNHRFLYRASINECVIHDSSYMELVELMGDEAQLVEVLTRFVPQDLLSDYDHPNHRKYRYGTRVARCMFYHPDQFPRGAICPVDLLWRATNTSMMTNHPPHYRTIWMWVHPLAIDELVKSIESELLLAHPHPQDRSSSQVILRRHDHRDLLRFDLFGRKTHRILRDILDVIPSEGAGDLWRKWRTWNFTPAHFPHQVVLALKVLDPRLLFPNKLRIRTSSHPPPSPEDSVEFTFDASETAISDIWDKSYRDRLRRHQLSEKQLNLRREHERQRRGQIHHLPASEIDARIPILLWRQEGFGQGWSMIVPSGWGMGFWKSLIYAGAHACSLRDRQHYAFENGIPYFPDDYVDTKSYQVETERSVEILRNLHLRRPPAKRINYSFLEIDSPFRIPFDQLVTVEQHPDNSSSSSSIWVTRSSLDRLSSSYSPLLLSTCLIRVRIELSGSKGIPEHGALIYLYEPTADEIIIKKTENMDTTTHKIPMASTSITPTAMTIKQNSPSLSSDSLLYTDFKLRPKAIGYITQGGQSFREGRALGYGYISYDSLTKRCLSSFNSNKRVRGFFRNRTSLHMRPIYIKCL